MVKQFLKRDGNSWLLDTGNKGPPGPPGPVGPPGDPGSSDVIFDGGTIVENIRSDRALTQSPIDTDYNGQINLSSTGDVGDSILPVRSITPGTSNNFTAILSGNFNENKSGYSVITGGMGNRIINITTNPTFSFIGGGRDNSIEEGVGSAGNLIVGGTNNSIQESSYNSCILGGVDNVGGGGRSAILGGSNHTINSSTNLSTIVGGFGHILGSSADYSVIVGGSTNDILNSDYSTVIAGLENTINAANYSAIVAGYNNEVIGTLSYSGVFCGNENSINGSFNSAIVAGFSGSISNNTSYAAIIGGNNNTIDSGTQSVILGGLNNQITNNSINSIVTGGFANSIQSNHAAIIGGNSNNILTDIYSSSDTSAIIGGFNHTITGSLQCIIIGGNNNSIATDISDSAIISGLNNTIFGARSIILGGSDNSNGGLSSTIISSLNSSIATTGLYSTAIGTRVNTIRYGQLSHSSLNDKFGSTPGLSQFSIYSVGAQSVGDTPVQLTDGNNAQLILEDNKSYTIKATCIANRTGSSNRFTSVNYILAHQTGGIAVIDNTTSIYTANDGVTWTIGYSVSGTNNILSATFVGTAAQNANVMVTYEIYEIIGGV